MRWIPIGLTTLVAGPLLSFGGPGPVAAEAKVAAVEPVGSCSALGQEVLGATAAVAQPGWPKGTIDLVNDPHRFYSMWVNGNEAFYYIGEANAASLALSAFAKIPAPTHRVVILPTSGRTGTFSGAEVCYDYALHVPSGLYRHWLVEEHGEESPLVHPNMVIHVGGSNIDLARLRIPPGLQVLGPDQLAAEAIDRLSDAAPEARMAAAAALAGFGYLDGVVEKLCECLDDPDAAVARTAACSLGQIGPPARPALDPICRLLATAADPDAQEVFQKAVHGIEGRAVPEDDGIAATLEALRDKLR